jgi:hypothetical protein
MGCPDRLNSASGKVFQSQFLACLHIPEASLEWHTVSGNTV